MLVVTTVDKGREAVRDAQRLGRIVGLVPTMGALHEGHLSLVREARRRCQYVALTIFVNPAQFAGGEDYAVYPRPLEADLAACRTAGVDLVFAPEVGTMYGPDAKTTVRVASLTEVLCGPRRPGHFEGVTTVVTKLFNILPADLAFFGEKDYQQLTVIRRMVADLNLPIEVVGCPTVREPDGLAMSSRNSYLSAAHRRQASCLSRALFAARDAAAAGQRDVQKLVSAVRKTILDAGPADVEYVEIVDAATLQALAVIDRPARICLAVRIGPTRLIDNVAVDAGRAGD